MDHLQVLRDKIARLRAEIAHIHVLNQEYRLRPGNATEDQVAHGNRHERLQAIQQELTQVQDLGRRVVSVEKMKEKTRERLPVIKQARAS
jgi:transcriptional regulator of NAD metabolism